MSELNRFFLLLNSFYSLFFDNVTHLDNNATRSVWFGLCGCMSILLSSRTRERKHHRRRWHRLNKIRICPALVVSVSNVRASANKRWYLVSLCNRLPFHPTETSIAVYNEVVYLTACLPASCVHIHWASEMDEKSPFALESHNEIFILIFLLAFPSRRGPNGAACAWIWCVYYVIPLSVFRSVDINRLSPYDVYVLTSCAHTQSLFL